MFKVGEPIIASHSYNGGTGLLTASIQSVGELTTSDYRVFRTPTGYDIVRQSDNYTWAVTSAGPLDYTMDGVNFRLASGAPNIGTRFWFSLPAMEPVISPC